MDPNKAPLGSGMAQKAAEKIRERKFKMQEAEAAALGASPATTPTPSAPSQSVDFFKPRSEEEKKAQARKLEEMLRNRK